MNRYHTLRTLLLTALLGAAMASCNKDESEPLPASGDGVIRMSAEIASAPQSKGISLTNGTQTGLVFLRKDDAGATAPSSFADAVSFTADRAADGALSNYSAQQLYDLNDNYAYFVGYHPAGTINSGTTSWTLANGGKTDLILTQAVWGAGRFSAPLTSGMTFEHQLARLQVICTADTSVPINLVQSTWGQITKIEILETATTATFDHATLAMSFSGSTTLNLSAADCQTDLTNTTLTASNTTPCAGGIFAPVVATTPIKLKVYTTTTTGGQTVDVQLKSGNTNMGFAKGMTHTATLTFGVSDKNIEVTTTSIEAWVAGGTGGANDITSAPIKAPSQGVLDMRNPELIKSGSMYTTQANITSTKKSYNGYTYSPSNASNNGGYIMNISSVFAEPAYYRLEVAKADETGSAGTNGWDTAETTIWTTAWDACKAKTPTGAWRLPRTSELALMYLNRTELANTQGFATFAQAYYWSSTEIYSSNSWCVSFGNGNTGSNGKANALTVRCVREL